MPWRSDSPPRNNSEAIPRDAAGADPLEHDGPVLDLRFNRPERRNSLTDPIVYALTDTMDAAASDESVRVIHLEGEGEHFCSGFDLARTDTGARTPPGGLGAPTHERRTSTASSPRC